MMRRRIVHANDIAPTGTKSAGITLNSAMPFAKMLRELSN